VALISQKSDAALKDASSKVYVGCFVGAARINNASLAKMTTLIKTEFNSVTPGNDMKWDGTEPSSGQFSFANTDVDAAFATNNSMKLRGHTLVWHQQLPSWVNSVAKANMNSTMQKHIEGVAGHLKGKVYAWDVVNEPFNEDGTLRSSPFYNNLGEGFIASAFTFAHAADPNAKLYLNEYNNEGINAKSTGMYNLLSKLVKNEVPIHGAGFQAHFIVGQLPKDLTQNLKRFSDLGLDVAITELDIRVKTPASDADLKQQAADFATVAKSCLAVERCVGITVTGSIDSNSWVQSQFPGYGAPNLWDDNYNQKLAYTSFATALKG